MPHGFKDLKLYMRSKFEASSALVEKSMIKVQVGLFSKSGDKIQVAPSHDFRVAVRMQNSSSHEQKQSLSYWIVDSNKIQVVCSTTGVEFYHFNLALSKKKKRHLVACTLTIVSECLEKRSYELLAW